MSRAQVSQSSPSHSIGTHSSVTQQSLPFTKLRKQFCSLLILFRLKKKTERFVARGVCQILGARRFSATPGQKAMTLVSKSSQQIADDRSKGYEKKKNAPVPVRTSCPCVSVRTWFARVGVREAMRAGRMTCRKVGSCQIVQTSLCLWFGFLGCSWPTCLSLMLVSSPGAENVAGTVLGIVAIAF